MNTEKIILSQNDKKKIWKKKVLATLEPCPAKSYFLANGRFFHSGSHILLVIVISRCEYNIHMLYTHIRDITGFYPTDHGNVYVTGSEKTRHIVQTRIWRNARF